MRKISSLGLLPLLLTTGAFLSGCKGESEDGEIVINEAKPSKFKMTTSAVAPTSGGAPEKKK